MSESVDSPAATSPVGASAPEAGAAASAKKRGGGLSSMLLADLKQMAEGMGVGGAGAMKKAQLVEAIKKAQSAGPPVAAPDRPGQDKQSKQGGGQAKPENEQEGQDKQNKQSKQNGQDKQSKQGGQAKPESKQGGQDKQSKQGGPDKQTKQGGPDKQTKQGGQDKQTKQGGQDEQSGPDSGQSGEDDGNRTGRSRRRRGRDRNARPGAAPGGGGGNSAGGGQREPDTTILEDDVLVPAAGILDVLDSYAFVRTSGYLPGTEDVYVSLSMVRKFGLRRGDAIVGQVRHPREGERKEKFNPMVRIDSVNGAEPETAKSRPDFAELVPVNPVERLRLETGPQEVTGRLIDLVAPLGKGQRSLVLAPAKTGRTRILQSIAAAVTSNHPECHLMLVLLDERPEEVTDFQRSVKGEVIASTFDRPPGDHTTAAELAIERAKRLVELGHDVVILLDGLTRLGRAYHHQGSGAGRGQPAGIDGGAVYAAKRFFGAARNVENGGSLTIVATATAESSSSLDELLLEEYVATANSELRLSSAYAARQIFPAIDALGSATRREDVLLGEQEAQIVTTLRRALADSESGQALPSLIERVGRTQTNIELLTQLQRAQ